MSTYFKESELDDNSSSYITRVWRYYQSINDKIQFYRKQRWALIFVLMLIFLLRLYLTNGIFRF